MTNPTLQFLTKEISLFILFPLALLYIANFYFSRIASDLGVAFWFWIPWIFVYPFISAARLFAVPKNPLPIYAYIAMLFASSAMQIISSLIFYSDVTQLSHVQTLDIRARAERFTAITFLLYSIAAIISRITSHSRRTPSAPP